MALSYPLDILVSFPGWVTQFEPKWRQEQSRQANGVTIVKDLGSPLWVLTASSVSLAPNLLDAWRARLDALEGGLQLFRGYTSSRCYPIAYPNGSWPTGNAYNGAATVADIGTDNKTLSLSGLPAGFVLQEGDMMQLRGADLHRVVAGAVADGAGALGPIEVRPHLWPSLAAGAAVLLVKPWCPMALMPGTLSSQAEMATGRGTISFQAIEIRS